MQIVEEVSFIKISAAEMIWDMFSFYIENAEKQYIPTTGFRVLEGIFPAFFVNRGANRTNQSHNKSFPWNLSDFYLIRFSHAKGFNGMLCKLR